MGSLKALLRDTGGALHIQEPSHHEISNPQLKIFCLLSSRLVVQIHLGASVKNQAQHENLGFQGNFSCHKSGHRRWVHLVSACAAAESAFRIQSNPMILKMQDVQLIAEACRQRVH